jgi:tetratricopeptide (TPR) repeat protein
MNELEQGISALKAGQRDEARKLLASAIKQEPNNERAWKWMYNACENVTEQKHCLEQILRIHPNEPKSLEMLKELQFSKKQPELPKYKNLDEFGDKLQGWVKEPKSFPEFDRYAKELEERKEENKVRELVSQNLKKCPYCAEMVLEDAKVCKHCGKDIDQQVINSQKLMILGKSMQSLGCLMTLFISVPACLCIFFLLSQGK